MTFGLLSFLVFFGAREIKRVLSTVIGWVGAAPRSQYYIRCQGDVLRQNGGFECSPGALADFQGIRFEWELCNILTFRPANQ